MVTCGNEFSDMGERDDNSVFIQSHYATMADLSGGDFHGLLLEFDNIHDEAVDDLLTGGLHRFTGRISLLL